jgi:DNA adenine methylase
VEVFGGGLALLCAKAPSPVEVVNDINQELIAFYRVLKYHPAALHAELDLVPNCSPARPLRGRPVRTGLPLRSRPRLRRALSALRAPSRRDFEDYPAQSGFTEIQRAARWFLRNKLSFGGQGRHFAITRTQPLPGRRARAAALRALHDRLDHVTIENRDWRRILDAHDAAGTFFFLDPPYFDAGADNYAGWTESELSALCARLQTLKGRWLLTYQDHPVVRALLPGCRFCAVTRQKGIANIAGVTRGVRYREVIISPPTPGKPQRLAA